MKMWKVLTSFLQIEGSRNMNLKSFLSNFCITKPSLATICICSCYSGSDMHRKRAHSSLSLFVCVSNRLYIVLRYEMLVLLISATRVLHNGKEITSSIIRQYKCLHLQTSFLSG
jgi:hypothetical protein